LQTSQLGLQTAAQVEFGKAFGVVKVHRSRIVIVQLQMHTAKLTVRIRLDVFGDVQLFAIVVDGNAFLKELEKEKIS
jgi:hypothetical protein